MRYREKNRLVLNVKSWQFRYDFSSNVETKTTRLTEPDLNFRQDKQWREAQERDEQEYQSWIAQGGNLNDLESLESLA